MTDDREIFETIRGYIKANYMYDYVKAATVAGGTLPDIDGCYEKKMGICQDLAALAACMLRVQGVPTPADGAAMPERCTTHGTASSSTARRCSTTRRSS